MKTNIDVSQIKYTATKGRDGWFLFGHWNIDKDKVKNNEQMENLRQLLKSKNTQEILNFMSDNNISVDKLLHYGAAPLMYASFYDDMDIAKELLNLGANSHLT